MHKALHLYEFYQNQVEAKFFRTTAFDEESPLIGGAELYVVPDFAKTNVWMAAVKRRFQRSFMLLPSLNIAFTVRRRIPLRIRELRVAKRQDERGESGNI
ncbi:hypothetical protein X801_09350 [Opisthorchis viverrini]|uniref:Uncharacterized protein n=1 Tax=Opisthorchis viverrini TaxID=6198 RepID=A0A1S8WKK0_OPIVI|nr:hypothetical protein X801_09350 [Opisthorchis viverrini]